MGHISSIHVFEDSLEGGGFESLAVTAEDSLTIRDYGEGSRVRLLDIWGGNNVSKMDVSIRSSLRHDNERGMRWAHAFNPTQSGADGNPQLYLPPDWIEEYDRTETLIVDVSGTAADDACVTQSLYYEGGRTPGARMIGYEELQARRGKYVGIRVSPAPPAATSDLGTAEAMTTDDDRLHAGRDYAWLGITTDLPFTTLELNGPDTANMRIPIPGHRDPHLTSAYFADLSRRLQLPLIPVIHANNADNTFTRIADVGGGTAPLICLQLVELSTF